MSEESIEDRDRALYKIMINEGWSHEDVVAMITSVDRSKLDEMLAKLRSDPRRERDVEIKAPDQISAGVVDLNAAKIRGELERFHQEKELEKAHERRFRERLTALMRASELTPYSLIVVTLRALLEVLQDDGTDLEESKNNVANVLNVF